jgi:hypothetical protein
MSSAMMVKNATLCDGYMLIVVADSAGFTRKFWFILERWDRMTLARMMSFGQPSFLFPWNGVCLVGLRVQVVDMPETVDAMAH